MVLESVTRAASGASGWCLIQEQYLLGWMALDKIEQHSTLVAPKVAVQHPHEYLDDDLVCMWCNPGCSALVRDNHGLLSQV
jgi:hypothetical protein